MCSSTNLNGILVILTTFLSSSLPLSHPKCGLYGAPPCSNQYLPAPPGHAPKCARPGKTYCEHVDNYPTYLIKHLVHKWGYEARNLIIDESWNDFNAVKYFHSHHQSLSQAIPPTSFFDASTIFGSNNNLGYNYETPSSGALKQTNYPSFSDIILPKPGVKETNYLVYNAYNNPQTFDSKSNIALNIDPKVTQYNPSLWLKRYVRDLSKKNKMNPTIELSSSNLNSTKISRHSRNVSTNLEFPDVFQDTSKKSRMKRQSSGREALCETTSNYITPQAALNSQGNWMFVVNEPNTARQLVKTELCRSQQCANLCQLPNGYNSRCEQKFIQKRLVALNGNGQNLYTDTFWFPSCCVCTIANGF